MAALAASVTFTPRVRAWGGRCQTSHAWYASEPTATAKNSGCRRCSQIRQLALKTENNPSPARTCGSIHQLGVSRPVMIESMPTLLGSFIYAAEPSLYHALRDRLEYRNDRYGSSHGIRARGRLRL